MMPDSVFVRFLFLNLFHERRRHAGIVALSVVIVFLLSSVLFLSSSLQQSLLKAVENESDFVFQRVRGERLLSIPEEVGEKLMRIRGVTRLAPRVYGRYFVDGGRRSFLIMGIDFLDPQSNKTLASILSKSDLADFLDGNRMIIGERVSKWMSKHFYKENFLFMTPEGKSKRMRIAARLGRESELFSGDMIIMPIESAREILGIAEDRAMDYTFDVPNDSEWDAVRSKAEALDYDARVTDKKDSRRAYERLYNYKGGFFLSLFMIVLLAFVMTLSQRYSQVSLSERRNIGILRALGWSISDVLKLKSFETLVIILFSFVLGSALAYIFVFIGGAPVLADIFLGGADGAVNPVLEPTVDLFLLSSILILFAVPFMAAVLIPVWRVCAADPREVIS